MEKEKNVMMLIHDVSKTFRDTMRIKSESCGIPDSYRPILRMLHFHNGCTQLDICKWTHLKAPTISLTLRTMEQNGYIKRCENENDKRNTNIFVTEKGQELDSKIRALIDETEKEFLTNIDSKDLKYVENVLKNILNNTVMRTMEKK